MLSEIALVVPIVGMLEGKLPLGLGPSHRVLRDSRTVYISDVSKRCFLLDVYFIEYDEWLRAQQEQKNRICELAPGYEVQLVCKAGETGVLDMFQSDAELRQAFKLASRFTL